MTNLVEENVEREEEVANPYNARKDWHEGQEDKPFASAQGLYHEPEQPKKKKATRKAAPESDSQDSNYKKRYDDLKKHYDTKVNEFKQKEQELEAEARMTQQVEQESAYEEQLESFKEENPDLYDAVEAVTTNQTNELREKLSVLEQREAQIVRREAEETLRTSHPDFLELRESEEFHVWAEAQPEQIQDWIYNNPDNVSLAVKAIDLYKMEAGIATPTKTKRAQSQSSSGSAADLVSTKTKTVDANEPKIWTQREIAALSMQQYEKFEQEIDQALMEGRVVQ
ncbi:hypothetical protein N8469_00230 [bacterium]|nr:hypothetical protein [bacterium]